MWASSPTHTKLAYVGDDDYIIPQDLLQEVIKQ